VADTAPVAVLITATPPLVFTYAFCARNKRQTSGNVTPSF
jgi:hypothetical protein